MLSALYGVRQQARRVIEALMPAPESGLLIGILLGIPSDTPQSSKSAFQAIGTAHLWAISG